MKISTEIESVTRHFGDEKGLEALAKAGFDGWDFSLVAMCRYDKQTKSLLPNPHPLAVRDYLAYARHLRRVAEDLGLQCNQSHAPFPSTCAGVRDFLKRAIECTAEAGGSICVIHPLHLDTVAVNTEFYRGLLPFAKSCGVKIATENLLSRPRGSDTYYPATTSAPAGYLSLLESVNDPDFVACLDIGHAEITASTTTAVEMIHALGPHLQALHIHDNNKLLDQHLLPFTGDIDFAPIVKVLKATGYTGWLTLEADSFLNQLPRDQAEAGVSRLADTARRLQELYRQC